MRRMDQLAAHARAQAVFQEVLANVTPDQWEGATPCSEWTVAALVDHIVGGNTWVQGLAGRQPVAVPDDDRVAAVAASAEGAQAVFAADDGLTRMFELPFGTMPGAAFIGMRTSDAFVHAWDLAQATGQSTHLDDELAAEALAAARMRIQPQMRGEGRPFRAEQPCPEDRPIADQLAAFLGRNVT
jgi:uncharacterized protein (TIGR03086 family)